MNTAKLSAATANIDVCFCNATTFTVDCTHFQGQKLQNIPPLPPGTVNFLADGNQIATLDNNGELCLLGEGC